MIQVTDKSRCCGCNACGDVCPKDAISFHIDIEGFWYPVVDKERCINCGLCDNVCPVIHVEELKKNDLPQSECHAAIHKTLKCVLTALPVAYFQLWQKEPIKKEVM